MQPPHCIIICCTTTPIIQTSFKTAHSKQGSERRALLQKEQQLHDSSLESPAANAPQQDWPQHARVVQRRDGGGGGHICCRCAFAWLGCLPFTLHAQDGQLLFSRVNLNSNGQKEGGPKSKIKSVAPYSRPSDCTSPG